MIARARHGSAMYRPENLVTFRPSPPPPLWRRVLAAVGDAAFYALRPIAPAFPVIGALVGLMVARAIF